MFNKTWNWPKAHPGHRPPTRGLSAGSLSGPRVFARAFPFIGHHLSRLSGLPGRSSRSRAGFSPLRRSAGPPFSFPLHAGCPLGPALARAPRVAATFIVIWLARCCRRRPNSKKGPSAGGAPCLRGRRRSEGRRGEWRASRLGRVARLQQRCLRSPTANFAGAGHPVSALSLATTVVQFREFPRRRPRASSKTITTRGPRLPPSPKFKRRPRPAYFRSDSSRRLPDKCGSSICYSARPSDCGGPWAPPGGEAPSATALPGVSA